MASILDPNYKPKSSLESYLSGMASSYTGLIDLLGRNQQASPQGMLTAFARKQFGMQPPSTKGLTETLGLQAPPANSDTAAAYQLGQETAIMPERGMLSKGLMNFGKSVGVQAGTGVAVGKAVDALGSLDPKLALGGAVGALAAATLATRGRNNFIKSFGVDDAKPVVGSGNLSRGQSTGNRKALREENRLRNAEDTIDDVFTFDKAQATKFKANLDKLTPNPKEADSTKAAIEASKNIDNVFSTQNDMISAKFVNDIDKFFSKIGGKDAKFLSSAPVVKQIDEILDNLIIDSPVKGNQTAINELQNLRASLVNKSGTPRSFGALEFQKQFSSWSKRSKTGSGFLSDLDRTDATAIAAKIAGGFDGILDNAAATASNQTKKEAAQLLKIARENYKEGKTKLADMEALRVNRLFDVDNVNSLDGDTILNRLSKMNPELRGRSLLILDSAAPEFTDNIRKQMFDDLVSKGNINEGVDAAIKYNPSAFSAAFNQKLNKDPQLLEFLFPNKTARANFTKKAKEAGLIGNTQLGQAATVFNEGAQAVGDIASASGAGYQGKLAAGAVGKLDSLKRTVFTNDKELYDYFFKGTDIKSSFANKYIMQTGKEAGKEIEQQTRPVEAPEPTLEELMQPPVDQPMQQPQQAPTEAPMQSGEPSLEDLMMMSNPQQPNNTGMMQ